MTIYLTKEEYLQQRREWKERYKTLSISIRKTKIENKDAHKNNSFTYLNFSKIIHLKDDARSLLDELIKLKNIAQQSYLKNKSDILEKQ